METIIKKETARLAAEKGFKWPCLYFWSEDENEIYTYDISMNWNYDTVDEHNSARYNAPSQARLQKWLRDIHGMHPHICWLEDWQWNVDVYKWQDENGLLTPPGSGKGHTTFEDALEYGLMEALKLINNGRTISESPSGTNG